MPPKYIKTVRQLIYWEYANLIARAAGFEGNFGFIASRYKKLVSGEMKWSFSVRDHQKELEREHAACVYCGATTNLTIGSHHPDFSRQCGSTRCKVAGISGQLRLCLQKV